jgi:hypothetical protein
MKTNYINAKIWGKKQEDDDEGDTAYDSYA